MNSQLQSSLIGSFVTTVMMVMFSWIGLSEINTLGNPDSLDRLHNSQTKKSELPLHLLPEINMLEKASRYESRLIGAGASLSQQFTALEKIKSSQNAEAIFEYLLTNKNAVTQYYAIMGLQEIQSGLYHQYKYNFLNSNKDIEMMSGCSVYSEPIRKAVQEID